MGLRSRKFWIRAGYALTVVWVVGVVAVTGGNMGDPLFDLIFIVPLGAWIVAVTVARLFGSRNNDPPRP
ncbi:MAG: hypothetical protein GY791_01475 [Alphaproteobacteria bacterium]|nr:hypothetical protein [Alphaproteobacteria bacterium]